jgi:Fe2+ transport system protein FeoA
MVINLIDAQVGKTYKIIDVPKLDPCGNCKPCIRLRMMELGFYEDQKIRLTKHQYGVWLIELLSFDDNVDSTIALRDEELERIIIKEI